jgi:hypothetical protein
MSATYKILGQVAPAANAATTLYTAPVNTQAVCSTLSICNRGATSSFRVAVRQNGDALENRHYIVYDNWVNNSDTIFLTLGLTLSSNDIVTVSSSSADLSFSMFGTEII